MAAREFEYVYARYNPGQYPAENEHIDKLAADGWHVHTALPNYNEIYILWERAVPKKAKAEEEPAKEEKQAAPAPDPAPREGKFTIEAELEPAGS